MKTLSDDLSRWLGTLPEAIDGLKTAVSVEQIGTVIQIGDGIVQIIGLPWTRLGELLAFEDGSKGLAFNVSLNDVGAVLLSGGEKVKAGMRVRGTGEVVRVPVGPGLLGRVLDPTGMPLDGGPKVEAVRFDPIERKAPGIVDRALVTQPLMTGVTIVDAMIPLGRGQRELIIGDRKTGKTALAVDTVINQRDTDVICVYVAIGQKASNVEQIIAAVRKHGNFENCIFVTGEAGALPGAQWIAPYAACTMAEYFRDIGQHALLIIDDLSKHAIFYRQLSLL